MRAQATYATMMRFIHAVAQAGAAELREFDLTPAQFQLLVQVRRRPGVAQWQLVETFGVTKGNVSQLVKRLEEAGLLVRTRVKGSDELSLTSEGEALLQRAMPAHDEFMDRQFAALDRDELDTLLRLLGKLAPR
ncbi:MarR family winged helix-turn-helix transcriptional regulator [Microbacterium sp. NPDC057407]|uniref:MarR family winged helix-turn-helix transcriptional regulator n=1 Tax=Microbacterium sp. NPDC057407 TaxID=3346120 RepID=UPI0036722997